MENQEKSVSTNALLAWFQNRVTEDNKNIFNKCLGFILIVFVVVAFYIAIGVIVEDELGLRIDGHSTGIALAFPNAEDDCRLFDNPYYNYGDQSLYEPSTLPTIHLRSYVFEGSHDDIGLSRSKLKTFVPHEVKHFIKTDKSFNFLFICQDDAKVYSVVYADLAVITQQDQKAYLQKHISELKNSKSLPKDFEPRKIRYLRVNR